ncbi:unnamed protein product [Plutella xylostella]|uniref:(diamondback moth) hypothetical protein n=1 Tax=Plutella xylostella TaxID=51655 RepID=A0A8S4D047_PLUXY|nr:unnamed protein product [Plutella xylostella]
MSQMGHGAAYGYTAVLVAHYTDDRGNKMSNDDLSWIETPSWLVSKQRYEEATRVFIWLRGDSPRQRKEIEELIENDKLKQEASDNNLSAAESRLVCFVVLGAASSLMSHGAAFGYPAILVAHYTDDQGNKMSNEDLSWIETPSWLVSKQRYGEARKVFTWLRGDGPRQRKEIEDLIEKTKDRTLLDIESEFRDKKTEEPHLEVKCFVVLGAATSLMGHGAGFGYTATLVAHYTDDQGNKMSNEDLSWIEDGGNDTKVSQCLLCLYTKQQHQSTPKTPPRRRRRLDFFSKRRRRRAAASTLVQ